MKTDQAAKRPAKSDRSTNRFLYIKQKDGTYLVYEIKKDGTRRGIGRHIPVKF